MFIILLKFPGLARTEAICTRNYINTGSENPIIKIKLRVTLPKWDVVR